MAAMAFSYMLCMSRTSHSSMPPDEMTRLKMTRCDDTSNEMLFPDQQRQCTVSWWRHKTFLVTGVQWIWRLWFCIQAWSQPACHQCTLVVLDSSQPHSLEPSWPGLAIQGLDNCLSHGWHPCLCRGGWEVGGFNGVYFYVGVRVPVTLYIWVSHWTSRFPRLI